MIDFSTYFFFLFFLFFHLSKLGQCPVKGEDPRSSMKTDTPAIRRRLSVNICNWLVYARQLFRDGTVKIAANVNIGGISRRDENDFRRGAGALLSLGTLEPFCPIDSRERSASLRNLQTVDRLSILFFFSLSLFLVSRLQTTPVERYSGPNDNVFVGRFLHFTNE